MDCAERLYSNTSSEGREEIRNELRNLRERWEQYLDKLAAVDHAVEQALARWNSFNEQLKDLDGWMKETAMKLAAHGPNDSFQDKKDELQRLKVTWWMTIASTLVLEKNLCHVEMNLVIVHCWNGSK